jgi:hypothetical protein
MFRALLADPQEVLKRNIKEDYADEFVNSTVFSHTYTEL